LANPALAENFIRAVHAACSYSCTEAIASADVESRDLALIADLLGQRV
jgi:hypothetical protein